MKSVFLFADYGDRFYPFGNGFPWAYSFVSIQEATQAALILAKVSTRKLNNFSIRADVHDEHHHHTAYPELISISLDDAFTTRLRSIPTNDKKAKDRKRQFTNPKGAKRKLEVIDVSLTNDEIRLFNDEILANIKMQCDKIGIPYDEDIYPRADRNRKLASSAKLLEEQNAQKMTPDNHRQEPDSIKTIFNELSYSKLNKYVYDGKPHITKGLGLPLTNPPKEKKEEIPVELEAPKPKNHAFEFSLPSAEDIAEQELIATRSDHVLVWGRNAQDVNAQVIMHYSSQITTARASSQQKIADAINDIRSELLDENPIYVCGFLRALFNVFGIKTAAKRCRFERLKDHFSTLIDAMGEDIEASQQTMTIAENGREQMPEILQCLQAYNNKLFDHYKLYEQAAQNGSVERDPEIVDRLKKRRSLLDESIERNETAQVNLKSVISQQEKHIADMDTLRTNIMNGFMTRIEIALTIEKTRDDISLSALKQIDTIGQLLDDLNTLTNKVGETLQIECTNDNILLLENKMEGPQLMLLPPPTKLDVA